MSALQPFVAVRVKCGGSAGMFLPEGEVLPERCLVPAVGRLQLFVRHFDQGPLDCPDISLGEPPVAVAQRPEIEDAVAENPPGAVHIRIDVAHDQIPHRSVDGLAPVEPGIARASHRSVPPLVTEKEDDVVEFVLRLEIEKQGWVSVLFQDGRRRKCRLEAVRLPVPDHTPERAKRLSVFLPIIGEGAQKPLDLSRRPEPLDNGPFSRPKGRSVWPRRKLLPWRGCLAHGLDLGRGARLRVHSHAFNALGARYCRSGANRGPTMVFLVLRAPASHPAARLFLESCWTIAFSAHRVKGKVAGWCLAGRRSATPSVRLAGLTIDGMHYAAKGRKKSGSPCSASRI
ncbi:MAG: hypothetical protein H6Q85_1636, partial [candidate division NC10 bacterium]|nr:hypothetical protein [candidate division NC10 bacterium]